MFASQRCFRFVGSILLAFCLATIYVSAQTTTGTILGTVRDASGGVVPDARVSAVNEATGFARQASTESSGEYVLTLLPVGSYTLTVRADGFKTKVLSGVVVEIDQKARVDVSLEIGRVTEEVHVVGEVPLVRTETAEVGEVIENKRIVQLPLNGRQFLQLSLLTPGVTINASGGLGQQMSGLTGPRITVMGARETDNHFTLDGVLLQDRMFNTLAASPAIDAIDQFKVQSDLYSADAGGYGGAQVNITIKSGTNNFHGAAYEFLRNQVFDARNFFDPSQKPPFRQNQFGSTLGGPIRKDKTFFFMNYEGLRIRKALTGTFSVPNAQVRTGNFSGLPTIKDPTTGQPFPNNQIPANRILPVATDLLALVPLPNVPGQAGILRGSPNESDNVNQGNVRLDHRFSDKDTLFGRFTIYDVGSLQPFGFVQSGAPPAAIPGFGVFLDFRATNAAIGETHIFRPNLIGELRIGFNRTAGGQARQNAGNTFNEQHGIQGTTRDPAKAGYPRIVTGIYNTFGDVTNPITRRDNDFQNNYNLSWVRGSHSLKFGGEYTRIQFNPDVDPASVGQFTFTGAFTGNALADLLLGLPFNAIGATGSRLIYLRANQWHFFAQDDWKVTPRLTLNVGLRYEYDSPFSEVRNRLSDLDIPNRRLIIASSDGNTYPQSLWVPGIQSVIKIPIVTSQQTGINRALVNKDLLNFAPRFGFAVDVLGNHKTVLRSGYGIFYNQISLSNLSLRSAAPPFFNNVNATNSLTNQIPITTVLTNPLSGVPGWSPYDPNFKTPYYQQWNFGLAQLVHRDLLVEIQYVGSKGTHLLTNNLFNTPAPGFGPIAPRRLYPQFGGNAQEVSWATSSYEGLILRTEKRFSHGLMFVANYTYSKCIDEDSLAAGTLGTSPPQDPRDFRAERGLCTSDERHRFVFSGTYDIPSVSANRVLERFFGGWEVGSIVTVQTGLPFSVNLTSDRANTGNLNQRPNVICNPNDGPHNAQKWFNTSCFQLQSQFTFGDAGRDIVTAPGLATVDFSLLKNIVIREHQSVQFRAEFFNLFNHANFDIPNRLCTASTTGAPCTSPAFGSVLSAGDPRIIQFALKYLF